MTTHGHNGWNTFETWSFNLWYGDDLQAQAQDLVDEGTVVNHSVAFNIVEGYIDLLLEDLDMPTGFFGDVIGHAVSAIDVHEIAGHLVTDVEYKVVGVWDDGHECISIQHDIDEEVAVRFNGDNDDIELADVEYEEEDEDGNEHEEPRAYVELSSGVVLYLDECLRV